MKRRGRGKQEGRRDRGGGCGEVFEGQLFEGQDRSKDERATS